MVPVESIPTESRRRPHGLSPNGGSVSSLRIGRSIRMPSAASFPRGGARRPRGKRLARDRRVRHGRNPRHRPTLVAGLGADSRAQRQDLRPRARHPGRLVPQPRRVEHLLATAGRLLYGMRYHVSDMRATEIDGRMLYKSVRPGAAFEATYAPAGPPANAEEGSLEHFLVERYRLFSERRGRLITAVVAHEPWPLQPARARIAVNEMASPGLSSGVSRSCTSAGRSRR